MVIKREIKLRLISVSIQPKSEVADWRKRPWEMLPGCWPDLVTSTLCRLHLNNIITLETIIIGFVFFLNGQVNGPNDLDSITHTQSLVLRFMCAHVQNYERAIQAEQRPSDSDRRERKMCHPVALVQHLCVCACACVCWWCWQHWLFVTPSYLTSFFMLSLIILKNR